ncbi:growth-regulating factor 5-like [Prosopis cineraria]|uniref:growth-regulating factor 5-like n=1 Tax=Prosopis cineraria TaxID=364024 RepID=UPI00240F213D|nr:growth-regulating factor 5-like [Prosopis cineraria]XP_054824960.1 growth-regulating factor 5-like [Prosopis cineraria]
MSIPPAMWTGLQPSPFTLAQWQELEHQALIFKYLKAGLSVPPDLLAPIHKSLQLMPVPHSALGYGSYFGKKIDPEPGRCRRTDGKKWRCSRDAHPDSKYCERHMIRRRHRSRKPVEASQAAHPPAQSSEVSGGTRSGCGKSFASLPLHTNGTREGINLGNNLSQLQMESLPSEINSKEYRFGLESEVDEHDFFQKDLGSVRYLGFDPSSDSMWSQLSHISSNTVSESSDSSVMASNCFQLQAMPDAEPHSNIDAVTSKQLVYSGQLGSTGCLKQDYQSPQTLISTWPWKKELGSPVMDYRPNKDSTGNPDVNVDCCGSL